MMRKRYLISWIYKGVSGRDHWVMERKGHISPADIKRLEFILQDKWELDSPVIITNFVSLN